MPRLFGTSGIRGSAESLFTDQFSFDLGRTFAIFLSRHNQVGKMAVGMDPRPSSTRIKNGFMAGLTYEGRNVFDEGVTPVPSMNWLLKAADFIGSAMITGSHIKADLNGIKFFAFQEEILKEHEKEIEEIYEEIAEKVKVVGLDSEFPKDGQAKALYVKLLIETSQRVYPGWKVVVDPGNGAQSEVIQETLKDSGLNLVVINGDLSQEFMARDTEVEEDFTLLKEKVVEQGADLGIAYDADGDRVVFVDHTGRLLPGDYAGTILASEEETETIVTPINVSQVIEKIGKKVVRTKVGSPYVVAKMKEVGAGFGFEANGGGFFAKTILTRDGGMSTIKMLNLLKKRNKKLAELVDELPRYYLYKTKIDCPWEFEQKVLEAAKNKYSGAKVEETDGLKIWPNSESWILFRSSKNAPEFRVFTEARSEEEALKLGEEGLQLVKENISS